MFPNVSDFTKESFKAIVGSEKAMETFRKVFREFREDVKYSTDREYIPYSFEAMMISFGKQLDRDELLAKIKARIAHWSKAERLPSKKTPDEIKKMVMDEVALFEKLFTMHSVFDMGNKRPTGCDINTANKELAKLRSLTSDGSEEASPEPI